MNVILGEYIAFSHRLLHWGSKPQPHTTECLQNVNYRPRMALSFALADPSFESPYFDSVKYLPYPPLKLRLGLIAGLQIQYDHFSPLTVHTLGLYRRIFYSQKSYFNDGYFDKISDACQSIAFVLKQKKNNKQ